MDASGAVSAVDTARPGLSEVQRVTDTFVAPSKTFADILRSASWWLPFVLLAIVSVATTLVVDRQVGFARVAENQIHLNSKQADQFDAQPAEVKVAALHRAAGISRYIA